MHHFIFPSKDTYVTNLNGLENRNFGIDEILTVAAQAYTIASVEQYESASISSTNVSLENVINFTGSVDAYILGNTTYPVLTDNNGNFITVTGSIDGYVNPSGPSYCDFTSSMFTGDFTGSINGYVGSAVINGINYTDDVVGPLSDVSGSVTNLSGSLSGSMVTGQISGSMSGMICEFSGSMNMFAGTIIGLVLGEYSYYYPRIVAKSKTSSSRTLLKFDVSAISSSISKGEIVDPKFILRLNVLEQQELPFEYTIYAYPISQSWEMGDGRYAEVGSDRGTSWNYRNVSGGQLWHELNPKLTVGNYLTDEAYKEDAFSNGGGTWYYSIPNSFVAPTSSIYTPFFSVESSIPTFDQEYSSSLETNLSASFNDILSSSLSSVISDSMALQQNADGAYNLLVSIADPTYLNTSSSIADYLSTIDPTASISCSACTTCSEYETEYTSSTLFLQHLSSSIQNILRNSSSAASYADSTEQYYIELSSSMFTQNPTTFDEVYSILNDWSGSSYSASAYATNVNNTYIGFSSSLSSQMGTTDPYLVYVSQSMYPFLYTSSLDLFNAQFTSSATTSFSSSLIDYIRPQISQIELQTSESVANTLVQTFESPFYNSLVAGGSLIMSQSFSYEQADIKMDITPIVKSWIAGCIPNEGIILLTSEELTVNSASNGSLGFYSKETNTIYSPHIDVVWDDSNFNPGDLQPIDDNLPFVATIKNLKKEYKHDSVVRINVFARDKFPLKTFVKATQQTAYLTPKYLPEETYFSIKDTETEEVVIDFDEGTKLSCDLNGNYFMLDMSGLPQERYFKILIKTVMNGAVEVIDNNTYFKVVR